MWYDDIFFSKDNLDGKYVKLDLFVEESYFFNSDAMYNIDLSDFIRKYNLKRDFYKCGVKRKTEKSYVGSQISIYFSNDCDIESSDMKIGDHIVIYGKIIDYSIDMMDGYNNCGIIPKYITNNGQ